MHSLVIKYTYIAVQSVHLQNTFTFPKWNSELIKQ